MMIRIERNRSLKPFNTFGIDASAGYLFHLREPGELEELAAHPVFRELPSPEDNLLILGQGSNILFTSDFGGLVVKNGIKGIKLTGEDKSGVLVEASSGVVWNDLVHFAVNNGLAGIENLAMIPGTVGAAPVQNIGAYGAEAADTVVKVRLFDLAAGEWLELDNRECRFGYRDSIFKDELKGRAVITSVTFRLSARAELKLDYGDIREELGRRGVTRPSIKDVADVVSHIRRSKLPDPSELGNAGSFFRNPFIGSDEFERLSGAFPNVRHYRQGEGYKISAGWLIEHAGWKGRRLGNAGCYEKQALILVNHGGADGAEILELASRIRESVTEKFGISLESEVIIL